MTSSGIEAHSRLALDTSAFSRMRGGDSAVLDLLAAAEVVILPVTVLGEMEAGFLLGRRLKENRVRLAEFLAESFVKIRSTTPDVARRYGELFAQLKQAGTPIPVNDVWIAAATIDCGGHLLTFDRHFSRVPGLACTIL